MTATIDNQYIQIPSITTTDRDALTAANGMVIYNTTTSTFQIRQAGSWLDMYGTTSGRTPGGRLTLTSGTPVTGSDVTTATTLYYTKFLHDNIELYNGSRWNPYTFTELSISLSGYTASLPHDIFAYDSGGSVTLASTAWTNTTTRATSLVDQNGRLVKSGATGYLYLGTLGTTGSTGQTEDSLLNRLIWNKYNRVPKDIKVIEATDSWTYTGTSWRSLNNSTANRINFVRGINEDAVLLNFVLHYSTSASVMSAGIGLDSTSTPSGVYSRGGAAIVTSTNAHYAGMPSAGYHYLQLLEYSSAATTTFYGDNGGTFLQSGANGVVWC